MACITRHKMFGRESGKGKDGDDESVSSNLTGLSSRKGAKYAGGFNPSAPIDGIPGAVFSLLFLLKIVTIFMFVAIMISRITETVREYHTQFETFMNMLKQEVCQLYFCSYDSLISVFSFARLLRRVKNSGKFYDFWPSDWISIHITRIRNLVQML